LHTGLAAGDITGNDETKGSGNGKVEGKSREKRAAELQIQKELRRLGQVTVRGEKALGSWRDRDRDREPGGRGRGRELRHLISTRVERVVGVGYGIPG
jgi:hypothetical protein